MSENLEELLQRYPLLPGWSSPEVFSDDFSLGDLKLKMSGLISKHESLGVVTGSAAEAWGASLQRAYFELLERLAILEAMQDKQGVFGEYSLDGKKIRDVPTNFVFPESPQPEVWRFARSNGIALHTAFPRAALAAVRELVERDRLLRSWFGAFAPKKTFSTALSSIAAQYEVHSYDFGATKITSLGSAVHVAAVFGFPRSAEHPIISGFGAGFDPKEAEHKAVKECSQRLGFLWGEDIPSQTPTPAPTPDFHQDYFLSASMSSRLKAWLSGEHVAAASAALSDLKEFDCTVTDLTPQGMRENVFVVRALSEQALPLTFGIRSDGPWSALPASLHVHPFS